MAVLFYRDLRVDQVHTAQPRPWKRSNKVTLLSEEMPKNNHSLKASKNPKHHENLGKAELKVRKDLAQNNNISWDKKKDFLYKEASKIVKSVMSAPGGSSIKTLCYASPHPHKPSLLGLVTETCKNSKTLKAVLDSTKLIREVKLPESLLMVLLWDYYADRLQCGRWLQETIFQGRKARLHAEWVRAKLKHPISQSKEATECKWIRVNPLKKDSQLLTDFKKNWKQDTLAPTWLYSVPAKELSTLQPLIKEGHLVVQDKASCLPPLVLDPRSGEHLIDACAAPGNKTSLLAALLNSQSGPSSSTNNGSGKCITAFEQDKKRFGLLQETLRKTGAEAYVTAINADFLSVNPQDYPHVTGILVDPSCSGSGMTQHSLERSFDFKPSGLDVADEERLRRLSNFQMAILRHAMKFPGCKRIVYSTCSIHAIENEQVIGRALHKQSVNNDDDDDWRVGGPILPEWKRRGLEDEHPQAHLMVRADPKQDDTHGFFVALIVRQPK